MPIALLRRRVIIASRTAETLRPQFDEHLLFQNRQMPQADRMIVAMKLTSLLPALRTDRIRARILNLDHGLSSFQFGLQNADFGKIRLYQELVIASAANEKQIDSQIISGLPP